MQNLLHPPGSHPNPPSLGLDYKGGLLLNSALMDVLQKLHGLFSKSIFLAIGLLSAMALPVLAYMAWDGMKSLDTLKEKVALAHKIRANKQAYKAKVEAYQTFSKEVNQFLDGAKKARVLETDWVIYEVDIKDRMVSLGEIRTFLDNAQSSERYYFRPKLIQITSLFAEQLLPEAVLQQIDDASQAEEPSPSLNLLEEAPKEEEDTSPVGKQVLLTLKGTYMVKRP